MKLLDIYLNGFGKFQNKYLTFGEGINILYGKNEAGKTTIHNFIKGMFFGIDKKAGKNPNDPYYRFEPWSEPDIYKGSLRFFNDGTSYKIDRTFSEKSKYFSVTEEGEDIVVENPTEIINNALMGMSRLAYENTISISQLKTENKGGMFTEELKKFLNSLDTDDDSTAHALEACDYLRKQRENFEKKVYPDAVREYSQVLGEIKTREKELTDNEYKNYLEALKKTQENLQDQIAAKKEALDVLKKRTQNFARTLKTYGFESYADITNLKKQTVAIYRNYLNAREKVEGSSLPQRRILFIVIGVIIIIINTLILLSKYPNIIGLESIPPLETVFGGFISLVESTPIRMPMLIGIVYIIACIIIASSIFLFVATKQNEKTLEETAYTLMEIFSQHLGKHELTKRSFKEFLSHIEEMQSIYTSLKENKKRITALGADIASIESLQKGNSEQFRIERQKAYKFDQKLQNLITLKERSEQLKKIIESNDILQSEIDAINISIETISGLAKKLKSSFGSYLNQSASAILNDISNGAYNMLTINDNMDVNIYIDGKLISINSVSQAVVDQVYLAIRIATLRLFTNGKDDLPLIFDDSFVMYDDDRLESTLKWLANSYQGQVIVLTCQKREQVILSSASIPYVADSL